MLEPEIPKNETQRLQALEAYGILDSLEEAEYDDLTRLASQISGKKIALISLIDENRQWFKSKFGLDASQTDRSISFCGHAINNPNHPLIVKDSTLDARFSDNPLVTGDPHVIFYAGIPLVDENEFALGTLCVIDDKPGDISEQQLESLRILAKSVLNLLKLRKQNHQLKESENNLSQALAFNNHFFMVLTQGGEIESTSELLRKITPELELGRKFTDFFSWDARFHFDKWSLSGASKTSNLLFFDSLKHHQRFKFSLLKIGEKIFLAATPVINSDYILANYGLNISDFSPHDYIIEFLFLQQTTEMTLRDAQKALEYVTEKNQELIESNRKIEILARFPDENPNPVIRLDYQFKPLFWNIAAEKTFLKDFEITNETLGDKELIEKIKQVIECDKEILTTTLERNVNAYTINIVNIKKAEYLNIYVSDVTNFTTENKSLKTFYEKILDYFPVDIGVFDSEHRYLYVNRAGIKNEEVRNFMIGKTDYDYCDFRNLPYDMADFRRNKFKQATESHQTIVWEDEYKNEDGSVKFIERRFSPISTDGVLVDFVIGYGVDITLIKLSQKAVEEKNIMISEINENLERIVDQKTAQNQELTRTITNLDKMAMIGELTANITHDLNTPIGAIKAASESISFTLKNLFSGGFENCTLEQFNWAFSLNTETINLSIGGLQSLKEKENWDSFFTKILPYNEPDKASLIDGLVRSRVQPSDIETIRYILNQENRLELLDLMYHTLVIKTFNDSILLSSNKAADVIKNMRFYIKEGKKEAREEIVIEESIRSVLKVFQHNLNKGISVEFESNKELKILAQESKIYQLWSNIIKNAIDAMEGKGTISIKIFEENGFKLVTISNDGPVIPANVLPNIFNKFYTTKDRSSGTGLGLNIVKEILDELQATVSVSSVESLTTFTFKFKN